MNWTWLSWAYTFSLTVGTGYTLIAFLLGHVGGGHDGGHDSGHGGDSGHDSGDHSLHFPLFSPIAIAIFLTAFGAGGMIGQEVLKGRGHPALSLAVAGASGTAFALMIASAMAFVFRKTVASSHAREVDILGIEAQVVLTIPAAGTGKVTYDIAGSRFSAPARSTPGTEIPQGTTVIIREKDGQTLVVVAK
jgi:membrane protein implicated in regulation of membrane protease activity